MNSYSMAQKGFLDVKLAAYDVLASAIPDDLHERQIASRMGLPKAVVVAALSALECDGIVSRKEDGQWALAGA